MRKINPSFILASLCAGALLLGSAGCSSNPFSKSSDERSAGRVSDDKKITKDVKTALKNEPVYKFDTVDVQTFAGQVQLSGFVNTEEQRRRAEEIAKSQPGVAGVSNAIALKPEIQPTGRTGAGEQPHIYAEPNNSTNNSANPKNP